jgi:hypothetical protein
MGACGLDPAVCSLLQAQQSAVRSQVSIAVAAKRLDAQRQQGDAAIELLQAAVALSKSAGTGRALDAQV